MRISPRTDEWIELYITKCFALCRQSLELAAIGGRRRKWKCMFVCQYFFENKTSGFQTKSEPPQLFFLLIFIYYFEILILGFSSIAVTITLHSIRFRSHFCIKGNLRIEFLKWIDDDQHRILCPFKIIFDDIFFGRMYWFLFSNEVIPFFPINIHVVKSPNFPPPLHSITVWLKEE